MFPSPSIILFCPRDGADAHVLPSAPVAGLSSAGSVTDSDPYKNEPTSMKKSIAISPNIETLFGTRDENVRVLEDGLNVTVNLRSNGIELEGAARDVARAAQVFADYESLQRSGYTFNNSCLNRILLFLTWDSNS